MMPNQAAGSSTVGNNLKHKETFPTINRMGPVQCFTNWTLAKHMANLPLLLGPTFVGCVDLHVEANQPKGVGNAEAAQQSQNGPLSSLGRLVHRGSVTVSSTVP